MPFDPLHLVSSASDATKQQIVESFLEKLLAEYPIDAYHEIAARFDAQSMDYLETLRDEYNIQLDATDDPQAKYALLVKLARVCIALGDPIFLKEAERHIEQSLDLNRDKNLNNNVSSSYYMLAALNFRFAQARPDDERSLVWHYHLGSALTSNPSAKIHDQVKQHLATNWAESFNLIGTLFRSYNFSLTHHFGFDMSPTASPPTYTVDYDQDIEGLQGRLDALGDQASRGEYHDALRDCNEFILDLTALKEMHTGHMDALAFALEFREEILKQHDSHKDALKVNSDHIRMFNKTRSDSTDADTAFMAPSVAA